MCTHVRERRGGAGRQRESQSRQRHRESEKKERKKKKDRYIIRQTEFRGLRSEQEHEW